MYLCIASTERNNHHLILFDKGYKKENHDTHFSLLEAVDEFLQSENITPQAVQGIVVVVGVGSFSSVRIATTLANSWHFANKIPVLSISREQVFDLDACIDTFETGKIEGYILPTYSAPPNIGNANPK